MGTFAYFKFNDKSVLIFKPDNSSWMDYERDIYNTLRDSNKFDRFEMEYLNKMPIRQFISLISSPINDVCLSQINN